MSNSSSSVNFSLLNQSINRYVPLPLLFFGTIGNILNILVFTRRAFRNNICVTYFLASTIFDSLIIIFSLLPRVLYGYGIDPSQNSSILCKLRFFITYFSGYTAAWFISLACVERYLSSSMNTSRRGLITMKRAYLSMIVVIVMGFVIFGEQFFCIDINQQLLGAPQSCYQLKSNIHCQVVDSMMQCLFEILIPTLMMILFGLLTVKNVRQKLRRITTVQVNNVSIPMIPVMVSIHSKVQQQPINIIPARNMPLLSTAITRRAQKLDIQLLTMLFVQVAVFFLSTLPISIYKLYSVVTVYEAKSNLLKSIENTVFNVSVISLFVNNTVTFYIYTLCGGTFRKELIKLFRLT